MAEILFSLRLKLIIKEYVKPTLSLEGVQVMSEGVCWFSLLQDTQVAQFLHLRFLCLPLPYRDHDLKKKKVIIISPKLLICHRSVEAES